jgi:hypothetical protein
VKGREKDDGPYKVDSKWMKKGFSKTTGVVFDSMLSLRNKGKGCAVWLDNLFTEVALCRELLDLGIGCAGTVRTSKTPREYMEQDELSLEAAKEATLANEMPQIQVIDLTSLYTYEFLTDLRKADGKAEQLPSITSDLTNKNNAKQRLKHQQSLKRSLTEA